MIDLFKTNAQLSDLSEEQARGVNNRGARDLGVRGGIVVFAYPIIAIVFLAFNKEMAGHIIPVSLVFLLVLISTLRFFAGKKLSKASLENTTKYLRPYGWLSIGTALCLGIFSALMLFEAGFSQQFMIMLVVVAAIAGAAIGTIALYMNLWITFMLSAFLPIIISCSYLGYSGDKQGYFMALMTLMYPIFIILIGKRIANEYWRGQVGFIYLESKTKDLKSALGLLEEKESELRNHRDHLQDMVDEQVRDLRLAKEAAEHASESKSDFLANMSHELKTPIHAILSFSKIGQKKIGSVPVEKLNRYFSQINDSGKRLVALVDNLLDLAKMESLKMDYHLEKIDLMSIIEQNISEQEARLQELKLNVKVEPIQCETIADIDPVRIGQVVTNLFSNAIKFSPEGKTITLSIGQDIVYPGRRQSDGVTVPGLLFTIKDEGIGIPEEELNSIFDKFIQSSKTKTSAGGTGLGLSICKEIIEAHRGQIWAESNEMGGASFSFLIPIEKVVFKKENSDLESEEYRSEERVQSEPGLETV